MKINDINRAGIVHSYQNQSRGDKASSLQRKGKAKDEVQISDEAKQLLGTQESDPARSAKITDLKNMVTTGTYRVDAGKIAEKLLPYLDR